MEIVRENLLGYFGELREYAESKGIKAVLIDSASALQANTRRFTAQSLLAYQDFLEGKISLKELNRRVRRTKSKLKYLIANLSKGRSDFMANRIRDSNADIVIVGNTHAKHLEKVIPLKKRITVKCRLTLMASILDYMLFRIYRMHRRAVKAKRMVIGRKVKRRVRK